MLRRAGANESGSGDYGGAGAYPPVPEVFSLPLNLGSPETCQRFSLSPSEGERAGVRSPRGPWRSEQGRASLACPALGIASRKRGRRDILPYVELKEERETAPRLVNSEMLVRARAGGRQAKSSLPPWLCSQPQSLKFDVSRGGGRGLRRPQPSGTICGARKSA